MFNTFLKRLPLPLTGIILALFSMGNLYKDSAPQMRSIIGFFAVVLFAAVLLKLVFARAAVGEELKNPIVISVLPTLSMALLISVTYLVPFSKPAAVALWWVGLALHICFMVFYIVRVLMPFDMKKIFPTLFIPFVGVVCASVSSPAVGQEALGQAIFWFGLVAFIACLPVALYRVFGGIAIPQPARPTAMIFAAPSALLLVGYLNAFEAKAVGMVIALGACAVVLLLLALFLSWKTLKDSFTPTFAAFTFPLTISALATAGAGKFLTKQGFHCPVLPYLAPTIMVLAWAGILYALVRYALHLFQAEHQA